MNHIAENINNVFDYLDSNNKFTDQSHRVVALVLVIANKANKVHNNIVRDHKYYHYHRQNMSKCKMPDTSRILFILEILWVCISTPFVKICFELNNFYLTIPYFNTCQVSCIGKINIRLLLLLALIYKITRHLKQ